MKLSRCVTDLLDVVLGRLVGHGHQLVPQQPPEGPDVVPLWSSVQTIAIPVARRRLLRGNDSVSKRAQTRKRNHPQPSFLETSRVDGVKAPLHFKTRRYAPAKPLRATASIAPPLDTLHKVCLKRTTQPPCFRGINPRGAAAKLSTRHRGYDDLRAASNPSAINVVDEG